MILKGIGVGVAAIGGTFFCLSLGTQIALPWLPYFLFAALCVAFIMAFVYAARHIDWTPDDKPAESQPASDESVK